MFAGEEENPMNQRDLIDPSFRQTIAKAVSRDSGSDSDKLDTATKEVSGDSEEQETSSKPDSIASLVDSMTDSDDPEEEKKVASKEDPDIDTIMESVLADMDFGND